MRREGRCEEDEKAYRRGLVYEGSRGREGEWGGVKENGMRKRTSEKGRDGSQEIEERIRATET